MTAREDEWMFEWAHASWWRFGEPELYARPCSSDLPRTATDRAHAIARNEPGEPPARAKRRLEAPPPLSKTHEPWWLDGADETT